jgi:hypothetical protein
MANPFTPPPPIHQVRLKPVPTKNAVPIQQNNTTKCSTMEKSTPAKFVPPTNFDSDLRSALAKRRSKVRGAEEGSESGNEEIVSQNHQHGEKKKDEEEERKVVNILVEGNGTTTNVGSVYFIYGMNGNIHSADIIPD